MGLIVAGLPPRQRIARSASNPVGGKGRASSARARLHIVCVDRGALVVLHPREGCLTRAAGRPVADCVYARLAVSGPWLSSLDGLTGAFYVRRCFGGLQLWEEVA